MYPKTTDPDIHREGLKRFPLHAIYRVQATRIVVLAVAHQRRRPDYWVGRIDR